jgi:hypothetical protein
LVRSADEAASLMQLAKVFAHALSSFEVQVRSLLHALSSVATESEPTTSVPQRKSDAKRAMKRVTNE